MRMKEHMAAEVDEHRKEMFLESTKDVKTHLTEMCRQVEEHMLDKADEVSMLMSCDYILVITCGHVPEGYEMPTPEKEMRSEIARIIREREESTENEDSDSGKVIKEDDCGQNKVKSEMDVDEAAEEQLEDRSETYGASERAADEDPFEDAEEQIQREAFKREDK